MTITFRKRKALVYVLHACRIILALTFVFSGFVKSVDPWGTAIKIGEYLAAFDMEWLYGWRFFFAVWLTGAELMLGLMVLFKVRLRLTSIFIFLSMIFFTGLTLILAIWNPVEDCGCFGDAIKLTNWETFIKNLVLLPMSAAVFWSSRKLPMMPTWKDGACMLLFGSIAFGIGVYSLNHLPLIDFLPYKKGTDLVAAMNAPGKGEIETTVVYRDRHTGREREFELTDTTWYDDSRWEYVDTKTKAIRTRVHPSVRDFAIFDSGDFVTDEVLHDPGVVYMVFASELDDIKPKCEKRLESAVAQAYGRGYRVMCVTAGSLREHPSIQLGDIEIPCYNMDASTIKTILRARVGVVVIRGGIIVDKVNCRDMLDKGILPEY